MAIDKYDVDLNSEEHININNKTESLQMLAVLYELKIWRVLYRWEGVVQLRTHHNRIRGVYRDKPETQISSWNT